MGQKRGPKWLILDNFEGPKIMKSGVMATFDILRSQKLANLEIWKSGNHDFVKILSPQKFFSGKKIFTIRQKIFCHPEKKISDPPEKIFGPQTKNFYQFQKFCDHQKWKITKMWHFRIFKNVKKSSKIDFWWWKKVKKTTFFSKIIWAINRTVTFSKKTRFWVIFTFPKSAIRGIKTAFLTKKGVRTRFF